MYPGTYFPTERPVGIHSIKPKYKTLNLQSSFGLLFNVVNCNIKFHDNSAVVKEVYSFYVAYTVSDPYSFDTDPEPDPSF
jgi:hypothetical protein